MQLRQNFPIEVKFCRRNAEDGVPYGDLCRDTPPGVSGPTRPRVGDTRGRVSLHALFRRERRLRSLRAAFGGCSPHAPEGAARRSSRRRRRFGVAAAKFAHRGQILPTERRGRRSLRGDPPKRVGATLAVVPVPTMNGGGAAPSRPVGIVFRSIGAFVQARYFAGGGLTRQGRRGCRRGRLHSI